MGRLDFIHGQHKAGKPQYADTLVRHAYRSVKPHSRYLVINDTPLRESYVAEGNYNSPTIGVVSLGEMFSSLIKTSPEGVKGQNWRVYEPQVIDYVLRTMHGVDRLLVNHHSAELLNGVYVQGLTDESTLALWDEFGKDGISSFHFLVSDFGSIRRRLKLQGESEERRYILGLERDLKEKYKHSRRMYKVVPGRKRYEHVVSFMPGTWQLMHEKYPNEASVEDSYAFHSPDFVEVMFDWWNPLSPLGELTPKKNYVIENL